MQTDNTQTFSSLSINRLLQMGWTNTSQTSRKVTLSGSCSIRKGLLTTLERAEEKLIIVDFSDPRNLPDSREIPRVLFEQYIDLNLIERICLWAIAQPAQANLLLCATPEGVSLLHAQRETPMGRCPANPNEETLESLLWVLSERGSAHRPVPDTLRLSQDIMRWFHLLEARLGSSLRWSSQDMQRLGRQLMLGLKVFQTTDIATKKFPESLGLEIRETAQLLELCWVPPPLPGLIGQLLEAAELYAPNATGAFNPFERQGLARQLTNLKPTHAMMLEGLLRLSAHKFSAMAQLPALVPSDNEPETWLLKLVEPIQISEAISCSDFYVFQPLELNLAECGVSRVLEAIEKLGLYIIEQRQIIENAGGRQLDMVESSINSTDDAWQQQPFNWVCKCALRLKLDPDFHQAIAYLIASHILELNQQPPFNQFPTHALTSLDDLFSNV